MSSSDRKPMSPLPDRNARKSPQERDGTPSPTNYNPLSPKDFSPDGSPLSSPRLGPLTAKSPTSDSPTSIDSPSSTTSSTESYLTILELKEEVKELRGGIKTLINHLNKTPMLPIKEDSSSLEEQLEIERIVLKSKNSELESENIKLKSELKGKPQLEKKFLDGEVTRLNQEITIGELTEQNKLLQEKNAFFEKFYKNSSPTSQPSQISSAKEIVKTPRTAAWHSNKK